MQIQANTMQFQIPQFIEAEDKIVGPLTLKQFLYIAVAGGFSFILFFLLQFWLWMMITIILGTAAITIAFVKYNGQPLAKIILQAFYYFWEPRLYIWQREPTFREVEIKGKKFTPALDMPSVKKLWNELLTTKAPIPKREKVMRIPTGKHPKEKFELFRKITGEKEIARRIDYR